MIETLLHVASWICLVSGTFFAVVGGIGLLRLPDLYTRMHAAGITDTLGAGLVIIGLALHAGSGLPALKLMMILFFLLVTSPTSSHAVARSALSHGIEPRLEPTENEPSTS